MHFSTAPIGKNLYGNATLHVMKTLTQVKAKLKKMRQGLAQKYHLRTIAIFGSFARNEQTEVSDIDIMVEFDRPVGLEFIDLANELEKNLNIKVDLVSRNGIKQRYYNVIQKDLIYV